MKRLSLLLLTLFYQLPAQALPPEGMVYQLKSSVVKIHVVNEQGHHGVGSGVVVAKDHVATNCHVVANARGVRVSKFGDGHAPVALKADWKHDLCLLRMQGLDLPVVKLGSTRDLHYAQPVFTISFPNNAKKPLTTYGEVTALYPMDGAHIIRATADFRLGGSGGPLFDDNGTLVGLVTMKSPGRNAYYYNIPADWVKDLINQPEIAVTTQKELPFWDAPEEQRPFFMRALQPEQTENWAELESICQSWVVAQPDSAEAWYLLGLAQIHQNRPESALASLEKTIALNQQHAEGKTLISEIKDRIASNKCSASSC
jgi:serine protease Do